MKQLIKALFTFWLRRRFDHLGRNSRLSPFGSYSHPGKISIGDNVYIGPRCIISASKGIHVGNGVTIGPEFIVMGGDHNFKKAGYKIHELTSGGVNETVRIEDDVWIGARVLILKGVVIGEGAVIGAGSVVTKSVPPYAIHAGNPAKYIGVRFSRKELERHLQCVGSRYQIVDFDFLENN